jgi:hypothetical protein
MCRFVAFFILLLLSSRAAACSCAEYGLSSEDALAAQNVFVFRVAETELLPSPDGESPFRVKARIEVLAHVRGRAKSTEVVYSIHDCCGIRIETGKEYIGFTRDNAQRFVGTSANILPIWGNFDRPTADALEAVLRGSRKIEDAFSYGTDEIHQIRPPPPPCPQERKVAR